MIDSIVLILEVLSVFVCVHRMSGQKISVNVYDISVCFVSYIYLEFINYFQLHSSFSVCTYLFFLVFCCIKFKDDILRAVVTVAFTIGLIVLAEFVIVIGVLGLHIQNISYRNLCTTGLLLFFVSVVLPWMKPDWIIKKLWQKPRIHEIVCISMAFISFVILGVLVAMKMNDAINIGLYIYGIPAIVIILALIFFWNKTLESGKIAKQELLLVEEMQNKCDELVAQVRQNQHGFDNHMMAVFATHYTCTTYEELVQVQKEYCGLLKEENKYNRLLLLGNKILSGFLFAKFEEWEKKGIVYHYKIKTEVNNCRVSYFYLIEMLGVLLDNAAEAVCSSGGSEEIYLEVDKINTKYIFKVANTCNEVSYAEMQNWFKLGKSSKGSGRGIGLFGLKKRTDEYGCKLRIENEKIGSRNWIVFRMAVEEGGK